MPNPNHDKQSRSCLGTFSGDGKPKGKPICMALEDWADEYVRAKPNRSRWLQQVIYKAIREELEE